MITCIQTCLCFLHFLQVTPLSLLGNYLDTQSAITTDVAIEGCQSYRTIV